MGKELSSLQYLGELLRSHADRVKFHYHGQDGVSLCTGCLRPVPR